MTIIYENDFSAGNFLFFVQSGGGGIGGGVGGGGSSGLGGDPGDDQGGYFWGREPGVAGSDGDPGDPGSTIGVTGDRGRDGSFTLRQVDELP